MRSVKRRIFSSRSHAGTGRQAAGCPAHGRGPVRRSRARMRSRASSLHASRRALFPRQGRGASVGGRPWRRAHQGPGAQTCGASCAQTGRGLQKEPVARAGCEQTIDHSLQASASDGLAAAAGAAGGRGIPAHGVVAQAVDQAGDRDLHRADLAAGAAQAWRPGSARRAGRGPLSAARTSMPMGPG